MQPLKLVKITPEIKRQAQVMLFSAKSSLHQAQRVTHAHDQLGQESGRPRGPMLERLEQNALVEFEQLLGIVNGTAASNYGGSVTPRRWLRLQKKFIPEPEL